MAQTIAYLTGCIWLTGIMVLILGSAIFKTLGIEEPGFMKKIKENPMSFFGLLYVINAFGSSFLSTGAFEVFIDGDLVFSKLAQGHVPNLDHIKEFLAMKGIAAN